MVGTVVVSGRMRVLFDRIDLPVGEEGDRVTGFRCRWCGFTAVVDDPGQLPDHECSGPPAARGRP